MQCVKQKSTHEYLKPPSSRKVQFKTGAEERGMQTRFRNIKFARLFGKIWQKREREIFVISPWLCIHHPVLTSYKTNINQIHVYFKTISQYSIDQINASGCTNHDIKDSNSIKNTKLGLCLLEHHVMFILFNQNNNYRSETNFKQ